MVSYKIPVGNLDIRTKVSEIQEGNLIATVILYISNERRKKILSMTLVIFYEGQKAPGY